MQADRRRDRRGVGRQTQGEDLFSQLNWLINFYPKQKFIAAQNLISIFTEFWPGCNAWCVPAQFIISITNCLSSLKLNFILSIIYVGERERGEAAAGSVWLRNSWLSAKSFRILFHYSRNGLQFTAQSLAFTWFAQCRHHTVNNRWWDWRVESGEK